jgi:hypothetical protein
LDRSCVDKEVVREVKEDSNILKTIKQRAGNWSGHIWRRNCLVRKFIEGKIYDKMKRKKTLAANE